MTTKAGPLDQEPIWGAEWLTEPPAKEVRFMLGLAGFLSKEEA